ncbi:MAG: PD-(D/E)XK nuclease family protein [Proteobacteria bacterium]|nr:PD-(D/E)XK nuclease family protein [Pseudomonadota bacterium]
MSVLSENVGCIITEMLKVIGYQHSAKLFSNLQSELGPDATLIVTANPLKADSLRLKWATHGKVDVVTFSKFSSTLAEKLNPNETKVAWRKSRLLLQLNAFKNLLPQGKELSYSEFKAAYQIFSDLRAYVPTQEFPDEILQHLDENVSLVAQLFHQAARSLEILDEHTGTQFLAEELRKPEGITLDQPVVIFEGFSFLTPVQISLVEALAIRHKVLVPVPQSVLDQAHPFDWVSIIRDGADEYLPSPAKNDSPQDFKLQLYPSGSLLALLKTKFEHLETPTQLLLSAKRLDAIIEQGIPLEFYQKKTSVDVLAEERERVFSMLEKRCLGGAKTAGAIDILPAIDEMIGEFKKSPTLTSARSLAVLQLIKSACLSVPKILDQQKMDAFFFQLLQEVVALDSPRNNLISMSPTSLAVNLLTIQDTHLLEPDKPVLLCIDSQFQSLMSQNRAFSPKLERELAKLGPVRRPELEFLYIEASLSEVWLHPQLEILVEEGVLEHDLGWKKIFSKAEPTFATATPLLTEVVPDFSFFKSESLPHSTNLISASRLQDYLDCPKKYHASRVAKITPMVTQVSEVDVMNLGNIEHELIKIGWENGESWWSEISNLEAEAKRLMVEKFGFSQLSPITLAGAAHEASLYSLNGLGALKRLTSKLPESRLEFAIKLDRSAGRQGEIDCLVRSPRTDFIIDFKRSKGQNPSLRQFQANFSKIQLWFYLNSIPLESSKDYGVGYLFLKDIEESWILTSEDACALLEEDFPNRVAAWKDFGVQFESYRLFEASALEKWRHEVNFLPQPSSKKICTFCDLSALCPKSSIDDEEEES